MKKTLYAGSFDPFTIGHLDIVSRALKIFDEVTILISVSPNKKPMLTLEEKISLLNDLFKNNEKVRVASWEGLTVDYAYKNKISTMIRGLRPTGDFDFEFQMAAMNHKLNSEIETVFLTSGEENFYISSSLVKEVYFHGGDIRPFLPENIYKFLKNRQE